MILSLIRGGHTRSGSGPPATLRPGAFLSARNCLRACKISPAYTYFRSVEQPREPDAAAIMPEPVNMSAPDNV